MDEALEEMLAYPHAPAPRAIERSIDAYVEHDARAGLGRIAVPTLVLAGQYDLGAPPRVVKRLADQIPGARYEVLAGAGHQQFQEDPALWNATVDAFWKSAG